jgi:SAM-dependent methyltransferase
VSIRAALRASLGRPYLRLALASRAGDAVLDAGCGPGHWLRWLAGARTDLRLAGVDRHRHPALPPEVAFHAMDLDVEPLPFADGAFRLVVCAHVLEHLRRPQVVLGELRRVLAAGGRLYVEMPSERSLRVPRAPRWFEPDIPLAFHDEPTHLWVPHSPGALASRLSDGGLRVLEAGRARSRGRWLGAGPRLVRGLAARDGRAVAESVEHLGGLASYVIATR